MAIGDGEEFYSVILHDQIVKHEWWLGFITGIMSCAAMGFTTYVIWHLSGW